MSDLKQELKQIADQITLAVAEDPFPEKISPESLRSAVRSYPMRGGKRLRPAILLWSCGALGGNPDQALPAAVAVEIYHNWTLVHDDIIDCDDFRRGLPTTHKELATHASAAFHCSPEKSGLFGKSFAILAGDLQQAWAVERMLSLTEKEVTPELALALIRRMQESLGRELISGEALDVEMEYRDFQTVNHKQLMHMISGKTGALLRFSAQCGGAIALKTADFDHPMLSALRSFAENLGLAFQLRDDYLGVFGEEKEFGKPLCSDFKEAKPTFLYLEAQARLTESGKKELAAMMGLGHYGQQEQQTIRTLLQSSGAVDALLNSVEELTAHALVGLKRLPETPYREKLLQLTSYLLQRTI